MSKNRYEKENGCERIFNYYQGQKNSYYSALEQIESYFSSPVGVGYEKAFLIARTQTIKTYENTIKRTENISFEDFQSWKKFYYVNDKSLEAFNKAKATALYDAKNRLDDAKTINYESFKKSKNYKYYKKIEEQGE